MDPHPSDDASSESLYMCACVNVFFFYWRSALLPLTRSLIATVAVDRFLIANTNTNANKKL